MNISITKKAWNKLTSILRSTNNQYGFLFSAKSGGCNGFNFQLNTLDKEKYTKLDNYKYKTVLTNRRTKVYIDPLSELYLVGTEIDYIKADYNKNIFESKFIYNVDKDILSTCGCGISFNKN